MGMDIQCSRQRQTSKLLLIGDENGASCKAFKQIYQHFERNNRQIYEELDVDMLICGYIRVEFDDFIPDEITQSVIATVGSFDLLSCCADGNKAVIDFETTMVKSGDLMKFTHLHNTRDISFYKQCHFFDACDGIMWCVSLGNDENQLQASLDSFVHLIKCKYFQKRTRISLILLFLDYEHFEQQEGNAADERFEFIYNLFLKQYKDANWPGPELPFFIANPWSSLLDEFDEHCVSTWYRRGMLV